MRAYKLFAAATALALAAGCTGDNGKNGVDGAKGDKGDKGDPGVAGTNGTDGSDGTDGTNGTDGKDGKDAACAAFGPLAISDVVGVSKAIFPGQTLEVSLTTSGGSSNVHVQFIGTMALLDGSAVLPDLPAAGANATTFTITPKTEGDLSYVAIATDGCTVATTTFHVKVRAALVSFVHLYPGIGDVGFAQRGDTQPLYQVVNTIFGPVPIATIPQGSGFPSYFRVAQSDFDVDMFPDADGDGVPDLDGTPSQLPKIALEPDMRVVVVAYANAAGALAWSVLHPDQSIIEDGVSARVQFAHFAGGAGPVDVATDEGMTTQIIQNATLGTLSPGIPLAPLDYTVYVDTDEDGTPNYEVGLGLETNLVLAGDYVIVMAWLDGDGQLRVFVHDTGGDGTQYAGLIFPFEGDVLPYLGPPDVTGASAAAADATADAPATIDLDVAAPADCGVQNLIFHYDMTTGGGTFGTDVSFSLTSPDGKTKVIGTGANGAEGADAGKLDATSAFLYTAANGKWTLTATVGFGDGATINSASLDFYCGEVLGAPDKTVHVDPDPDLDIPDSDATGVTSTATVNGACTVKFVEVDWAATHTFPPDLDFELKSPHGTDYVDLGGPTGLSEVSGSFGPLDDWSGENGAGAWTLHVVDNAGGDVGTLDEWTLNVYCE